MRRRYQTGLLDHLVRPEQLYARHAVACYWIVDPRGRTIDAYTLLEGSHRLAARLEGNEPRALPPIWV